MQAAGGSCSEGRTLLQLAEASPAMEETTVPGSPLQIQDMKYIALSSTPYHKVTTPAVPHLTSDTSADWSISMATPTAIRPLANRETPAITMTTDKEVSEVERSVERRRARPGVGQGVIRSLFRHKSPPSSSALTQSTNPPPFSPISASPLLHTHTTQDPHTLPLGTTSSFPTTHTVAETPTRLQRTRRSERDSVGLDQGFCCEDNLAISVSSQELFDSSSVFAEREGDCGESVKVVPDSPLLCSVPESPTARTPPPGELTARTPPPGELTARTPPPGELTTRTPPPGECWLAGPGPRSQRNKRKMDDGDDGFTAEPPEKRASCGDDSTADKPTTSDVPVDEAERPNEAEREVDEAERQNEAERKVDEAERQNEAEREVDEAERQNEAEREVGLEGEVAMQPAEGVCQREAEIESDRAPVEVTTPAQPQLPGFVGFQTASGRSLGLSAQSLERAHRLITEEQGSLPALSVLTHRQLTPATLPTASNHQRNLQSSGGLRPRGGQSRQFKPPRPARSVCAAEEKARVACLMRGLKLAGAGVGSEAVKTPQRTVCGFSTGSGKTLSVSTSSLMRAERLMSGDKENGVEPAGVIGRASSCVAPAGVVGTGVVETASSCVGFQSASGRAISVSAGAVERARSLFDSEPAPAETRASDEARATSEETDLQAYYIGKDDLTDFVIFSQFQGSVAAETEPTETEGVTTAEKREDDECSMYLSTQVVKQFLDFSEEQGEAEPQPVVPAATSSTSSQEEKEGEAEEVVKTASETLMDELFGAVSPEQLTVGVERREQPADCDSVKEGGGEASREGSGEASREGSGEASREGSREAIREGSREASREGGGEGSDELEACVCEPATEVGAEAACLAPSESPVTTGDGEPLPFPGLMTASGKKVEVSSTALSAVRETLSSPMAAGPAEQDRDSHAAGNGCAMSDDSHGAACPGLPLPGLMTAAGRRVEISEAALKRVRETVEPSGRPKVFLGLQTAAGQKVDISETALAAVRVSSSANPCTLTSDNSVSDSSCRAPRIRPQFRPLSSKPRLPGASVRYKPVFRAGQQAPPIQTLATPTLTPDDRHTQNQGLYTTPEGIMCDRVLGRRPLTPVQSFLRPDGSYMSTPLQRQIRSHLSVVRVCEADRDRGDESRAEREETLTDQFDTVQPTPAAEQRRGEGERQSTTESGGESTTKRGGQCEREQQSVREREGQNTTEREKDTGEWAAEELNDSLEEEPIVATPPIRRRRRKCAMPRSAGSLLSSHLLHWEIRLPLEVRGHPGRLSERELYRRGVHPATVAVTANSASLFQFSGGHFFSSAVLDGAVVCVGDGAMLRLQAGMAGPQQMWEAFAGSPGVDRRLVSVEWFLNHYRWVVWKLAAMEVGYPASCGGSSLTPDTVMRQMRYRYDREIEAAERPSLRRICERDDVSCRRMVLCVSGVYSGVHPRPQETELEYPTLELTDGWYSLPAILDRPLQYMVRSGRLQLGTKIMTYGAEIVGGADACHPLEAPPTLCLRLSANSTRRTRWYAQLGFQPSPHAFSLSLTSLFPDGGLVGYTEGIIARVYPIVFMEKVEGGRSIFRGRRAEERVAQQRHELRQREIERVTSRIQREFEDEIHSRGGSPVGRRRSRRLNTLQVKQLQDGEAIHTALANSPDPQALQEALSSMQLAMLESYHHTMLERRQTELRARVEQAVAMEQERGRLPQSHSSTPLLRLRLVPPGPSQTHLDCHLSVWRPREAVRSVLVEGKLVKMWNVNTSQASRRALSDSLQLVATSQTRFEPLETLTESTLVNYRPRECVSIGRLVRGEGVWCGEFDTVGVVVCVVSERLEQTETRPGRLVDTVYLADDKENSLAVRVWDGLEHHALQALLTPATAVSATSLTFRGPHPLSGHTLLATATDHTHFSQAPPQEHVQVELHQLEKALPSNRALYLESLEEEVMNIHLPFHHR